MKLSKNLVKMIALLEIATFVVGNTSVVKASSNSSHKQEQVSRHHLHSKKNNNDNLRKNSSSQTSKHSTASVTVVGEQNPGIDISPVLHFLGF
ncbi:hypothetical protein [Bombilactobacillus thymidiniphilus]|uniref:Uncharacterized protein n=1 Tax=Bombilactobacillus thymidiniphilus TaxID=2923363 RepID=A0ABY4PCW9_9LACO|nr:hypothetical protein [Bombilactobacillus thymidiniphilus]UQS83409.1 hypothetical protein MOO47_06450 [Bombilactobacillus thymidiniphilus]